MVSPLDVAWNVAKGELFHPSVAGYMAAGDEGVRAARPNAERESRPFASLDTMRENSEMTFHTPSIENMPPRTMRSVDRDYLRQLMQSVGRGKAVGPAGELDTLAHIGDEPIGAGLNVTQTLADRLDREQMLQRSSDSPIDTAWSILKQLSREDLEMAARTGGVPRMSGTMRPEFYGRPNYMDEEEPPVDMMTPLSPMNQPITDDFGNIIVNPKQTGGRGEFGGMVQEYNEAMFPDEEAEHRRINAPTPVSTPGVGDPNLHILQQRLQDMNYEIAQMNAAGIDPRTNLQLRNLMQERKKLMHRIGQRPPPIPGVPLPIEEAGDASMPDPSQMEHLGAQLTHADMMRDDLVDMSNVEGGGINRPAYNYIRERYEAARPFTVEDIMRRIMNGEQVSDEEIMYLQNSS